MKHTLCLLALFLGLSAQTIAQDTAQIEYGLQESEKVLVQDQREITLYKTEYVNSTCTRQEPYEDTECGNETRYRNECTWVPGRNICRNVNDRQCRDVRRTRRECTAGRTRRECVNEPARRVCRTRNGVERCTNVPGRQRCRDVAGPQVCRNVPYTDRECSNVTRRVCDWAPGGNVCTDVPYQEYVCRDVTRYRTISYACKKPVEVPYQAIKTFSHEVNFEFKDVDQIGKATISLALNSNGKLITNYTNLNLEETYINLLEESEEVLINTDSEFKSVKNIKINFGNLKSLTAPMDINLKSLWMNKSGDFKLTTSNTSELDGSRILLKVYKESNGDLHFAKDLKLSNFEVLDNALVIDLSNLGFNQIKGFLGKGVKLKVAVTVKVDSPKDLLVPIKVNLEKSKNFNIKVYKNK